MSILKSKPICVPVLDRSLRTVAAILLVFYALYSVSPKYASIVENAGRAGAKKDVVYGILCLNVILDNVLDDDEAAAAGAETAVAPDKQDSELYIVKKKRALSSQREDYKPSLSGYYLFSESNECNTAAAHVYAAFHDLLHRKADGFTVCHTGLSPPSDLS